MTAGNEVSVVLLPFANVHFDLTVTRNRAALSARTSPEALELRSIALVEVQSLPSLTRTVSSSGSSLSVNHNSSVFEHPLTSFIN